MKKTNIGNLKKGWTLKAEKLEMLRASRAVEQAADRGSGKGKSATAEELDRIFDEGKEDITDYVDRSKLQRPNLELRRVSVDMPVSMIRTIDREAQIRGMSRQSLIKAWLFQVIEEHGMAQSYERFKKERDLHSRWAYETHTVPTVEDGPLRLNLQGAIEALQRADEQAKELEEKIKR